MNLYVCLEVHTDATLQHGCNRLCVYKPFNPLGPIAPKVALLTSYCFVASHFETKFAHELVVLLVVC